MLAKLVTAIRRVILWDYPRATWQYDVMVALILAFIFLTPRQWFRDQPRIPRASRITRLPGAHGTDVFWIESRLLAGTPEAQMTQKTGKMLKLQDPSIGSVVRLEPVVDSENELKGYLAFTRP